MLKEDKKQQIEALYKLHGPFVIRRCKTILKNNSDADDATQEVFIRIIKNIETFKNESNPTTWIYRIATNVCIDIIRKKSSQPIQTLAFEIVDTIEHPSPRADIIALSRQEIDWIFSHLDPQSLQILVHTFLDEMSQEEIAQVIGISRKTVWTKLDKLKSKLERLKNAA